MSIGSDGWTRPTIKLKMKKIKNPEMTAESFIVGEKKENCATLNYKIFD